FLVLLAAAGIAMAFVGLYGVVTFSTNLQVRELALRCAIGASHMQLLRSIIGQPVAFGFAGIILGGIAGIALVTVLKGVLYGIEGAEPRMILAGALGVTATTIIAAALPAFRLLRVSPSDLLRSE